MKIEKRQRICYVTFLSVQQSYAVSLKNEESEE
jgi:hypothetical protein